MFLGKATKQKTPFDVASEEGLKKVLVDDYVGQLTFFFQHVTAK